MVIRRGRFPGKQKKTEEKPAKKSKKPNIKKGGVREGKYVSGRLKELGFDLNQRRWAISILDDLRGRKTILHSAFDMATGELHAGDIVHVLPFEPRVLGLNQFPADAKINAIALYLGKDSAKRDLLVITHFEPANPKSKAAGYVRSEPPIILSLGENANLHMDRIRLKPENMAISDWT